MRFAVDSAKQRTLTGLAIANFVWVFMSGSRGAATVAVCCLAFFVTQMPSAKTRLFFSLRLLVVTFVIAAVFPGVRDHALGKLQRLTDSNLSADQRTNGRSDLLAGGLRIFREHPLGVGTGGFPYNWALLNSVEGQKYFYRVGEKAPAHAGWITVATENGVVGVALLASFVLSFAIVSLGRRRPNTFGIGVFASVTLAVAFTSSDVSQMGLWFLAAGAITLIRRAGAGRLPHAFARQTWRSPVVRRTNAPRHCSCWGFRMQRGSCDAQRRRPRSFRRARSMCRG